MGATRGNNYRQKLFKILSKASKCDDVAWCKDDWTTASVPIVDGGWGGGCNRQQAQYKYIPLITVL